MCGLNGAAGTLDTKAEATFKDLLFLHVLRGDHSTGAASIGRGLTDKAKSAKCLGPPWLLMDMGRFKHDVMGGSNKVYMGHNRYATKGGITLGNAHPFLFENVFGAHNGTVPDHYTKDLPDKKYFATDSETIINSIDTLGIEETIKKINGAWALAWFDKRDNTINLLRNEKRPLYFAMDKDKKVLFWASELDLLAHALNRNHIERSKPAAYRIQPDQWFKFKIPNYNKAFEEPVVKKLTCAPEVAHDAGFFPRTSETGTGSTTKVSGITDHFSRGTHYYKYDSETGKYTEGNVIPAKFDRGKTHERIMEKRKGPQYPLIFRSPNCKIHYDLDTKKYHRYYFSEEDSTWQHASTDYAPVEIADRKLEDLLVAKVVATITVEAPPDPPVGKDEIIRHRTSHMWVTKRLRTGANPKPWVAYYWDKRTNHWYVHEDTTPPLEMPFTLLDVNSSHCFHTVKKKKKVPRAQYFKGYLGEPIDRERFNMICQDGCVGCGRIPRWLEGQIGGVRIHFINKQDFLCEFCGEDGKTYQELLETSKSAPTIN